MDISRRSFPLSLNPMRQKQRAISQQNIQSANVTRQIRPANGGSAESQIANLKQCISAYLDSIQMVCRAGTWLADTFSFLLNESPNGHTAKDMKTRFSKMLDASVMTTMQAKNDLTTLLMQISIPDLNCNNQTQAIEECRQINTKVLEKCIYCLSEVHNSFFKFELDVKVNVQSNGSLQQTEINDKKCTTQDKSDNSQPSANFFATEWERLTDIPCNTKSWLALKQKNMCLRKYNGLTSNEIQNLLKHGTVSDLYLEKLNHRIDTALRNYEVGLRAIPDEYTIVIGGFHSDTNKAKTSLLGCCSQSEMEQGTQRSSVAQFLHCELPLMGVTINKREFATDTKNSAANVNQKKNAVRQLLQSTNQKLSISETDDLASEILGDVCPARWRNHVKAALQLLYGNSGLIIMDTVSGDSNNSKRSAMISTKDNYIVVSVTSTWCLKEDPGTMSLLQRNLDPEKSMATIHVRYVSVFHNKASVSKRFEPGIFVETFLQTGSENRRRASQTLRATQTLSGVPLTPLSTYWLTNQYPVGNESPVLSTRIVTSSNLIDIKNQKKSVSTSSLTSKSEDSDGKSEKSKRKKKIVVEIKGDASSDDDDKSSDNDDSVKDVIYMLSGSSRKTSRRRQITQPEKKKVDQDTDELSKAIDDILDSTAFETDDRAGVNSPLNAAQKTVDRAPVAGNERVQPQNVTSQTAGYTNPPPTQIPVLPPSPFHQTKSQTLPGAIGRKKPTDNVEKPSKQSSNTLPMHARDMMWGMPFPQMSPQQLALNNLAMSAQSGVNQTPPPQFRPPFFPPPTSTPPFSGASPSISPRPYFNISQSTQPNQNSTWSPSNNYGALGNASPRGSDNGSVDMNEVLHGMKNLAANSGVPAGPRHSNTPGFQTQLSMMHGTNLNNNNLMAGMRGSRSLPHPALHHYGDLSRSLTAPTEVNKHNFTNEIPPMHFQCQFQLNEREVNDMRTTNVGNSVASHSKDSFGPIGSPVISRQKKEQDLSLQQSNSNTWPFLNEVAGLGDDRVADKGDQDYQNYIAEVTRRAMFRKQMSNPVTQPFDPTDVTAWSNSILWENQGFEQSSQSRAMFVNNSGDASVDGNSNILAAQPDVSTDQSKTGTWPPWQMWPSTPNDNTGIWNWGNNDAAMRNIQS